MDKDMEKSLKKGLEIGIGMTSIAAAALTEVLNKLEKEGKISSKESEKIARQVVQKYKAKGNQYAKEAQKQFNMVMDAIPFATKKDIEQLHKRIDGLSKLKTSKKSKKSGKK